MPNFDTAAQSFMASMSAAAPKIDMPEVINKWSDYYQSPTDYKALGNATYASFLSPFQTILEFAGQALATAAISTSMSLATIILAATSAYFLFQSVQALLSTPAGTEDDQVLNKFKLSAMTGTAAYLIHFISPFVMPVLMTSLAVRSAVTLYDNQSAVAGFFSQNDGTSSDDIAPPVNART